MREREGATNDTWQGKYMQKRKRRKKERRKTYLKIGLIKQYRTGGRHILLVLRLQKKREDKKKGISQQEYGVSHRKALYKITKMK